jgi:hypothetical protein
MRAGRDDKAGLKKETGEEAKCVTRSDVMWSTIDVVLIASLAGCFAFALGVVLTGASERDSIRKACKAGVLICDSEGYLLIKQSKSSRDPIIGTGVT